jgi:HD-like signal output (HDOD) protein
MIHVFTQFDRRLAPGFSPEALISHSLRVGLFARRIAQAEGADSELANDAFSGGLLHDVGRLVMVVNLPQQYAQMLEWRRDSARTWDEAEREAFGAAHSDVGAYLLGLWGLPRPIIEAVAFHHQPAKSLTRDFCPVTAVHVANVIEHELRGDRSGDDAPGDAFDRDYLREVGAADRVDVWRAICARVASEEAL